jgi:hypothetical protein
VGARSQDRIRPQPGGGAIVLVEDERNAAAIARVPALSTLIAIARVLDARKVLDTRYGGKGEIRYAAAVTPPAFLTDAIIRAGASVCDSRGERVLAPPSPAAIAPVVDTAFAELAHHVRASLGATTMAAALEKAEAARRKAPLDRDANPAAYWTAVFELTALAGELARGKGGRWVETSETPVPFALKFPSGALAMPDKAAQRIALGAEPDEPLGRAE